MTAAGRPSTLPKPATTPSAGVVRPFMDGAMLAWVASTPISWKEPGSKSRSRRSRTVSLPSACCLAMASGPPIASARWRRPRRSSTRSFMPTELPLDDGGVIERDPGVGRRAADQRDHGRGLAPMVGGVIDDVLKQRAQRHAELLARGVLVGDRPREIGLSEAVDERALLGLEAVPAGSQVRHRAEIRVAGYPGRRDALPAREPDVVGAVDVGEHALERGEAPVLAQVAGGRVA